MDQSAPAKRKKASTSEPLSSVGSAYAADDSEPFRRILPIMQNTIGIVDTNASEALIAALLFVQRKVARHPSHYLIMKAIEEPKGERLFTDFLSVYLFIEAYDNEELLEFLVQNRLIESIATLIQDKMSKAGKVSQHAKIYARCLDLTNYYNILLQDDQHTLEFDNECLKSMLQVALRYCEYSKTKMPLNPRFNWGAMLNRVQYCISVIQPKLPTDINIVRLQRRLLELTQYIHILLHSPTQPMIDDTKYKLDTMLKAISQAN